MANQLTKLAIVSYTPAIPYRPAREAYCYWRRETVEGFWDLQLVAVYVESNNALTIGGTPGRQLVFQTQPVWRPGGVVETRVCLPADPGQQGVPEQTTYTPISGWNSGARSVAPLLADGRFEFNVKSGAIGVVVGLVSQDAGTLPSEATHAFYVSRSTIKVYESGVEILTVPEPHIESETFVIERSGVVVTYRYGDWAHTSLVPAVDQQFLDAALYFTGDTVFDPALVLSVGAEGIGYASLRPVNVLASDLDYDTDGGDAVGYARTPLVVAQGQVNNTVIGTALATLRGVQVFSSSMTRYAEGSATLPSVTARGEDGIVVPEFSYGYATLWPLSSVGVGLTGELGSATATLRAVDVLASNYPMRYGQAYSTLQSLDIVNATLVLPEDDLPVTMSGMGVYDFYFTDERVQAQINDGLSLTDSLLAVVSITDTTFDMLELRDALTFTQAVESIIRSGLTVTGDTNAAQRAAVQYAVNVLTGGLSTYSGFEFDRFVQTTTQVYGARADGVYVLRPGDDNGLPINIEIDFGADDFATPAAKSVEAVYLGMATDGQAYLRTNNDGEERTYRVVQRGPIMRAVMAKGVTGRRWNLKLEVVDATQFELDLVEVIVGVRARRWTR